MVAVELQAELTNHTSSNRSRKVTVERRKVAGKQLRFNWDEKETTVQPSVKTAPSAQPVAPAQPQPTPAAPKTAPVPPRKTSVKPAPTKSRVGDTTKLGVVMLRLLKSYGISDEEIIEGLSLPSVG